MCYIYLQFYYNFIYQILFLCYIYINNVNNIIVVSSKWEIKVQNKKRKNYYRLSNGYIELIIDIYFFLQIDSYFFIYIVFFKQDEYYQ